MAEALRFFPFGTTIPAQANHSDNSIAFGYTAFMESEVEERPFQHIFESVSDGLIIHDAQTGLVVEANPAAFLHPDSQHLLHDYHQAAQAGGLFAATAVHRRRDGPPFYRVCQEALTNIAKHAGASQVEIDLRYETDTVTLGQSGWNKEVR